MFKSEFYSSFCKGASVIQALHFSVLIVLLFALGLPLGQPLFPLLPVVVWVSLLLSILLHTHRLAQEENEDGYVAQFLLTSSILWFRLVEQLTARWLGFILPYGFMVFLLLLALGGDFHFAAHAILGLGIGSLALFALGGVGAVLTLGVRQASLLLPLLLLPFYVPTLIFGTHYLYGIMEGEAQAQAWLYLLCANTLFCCTISPYFTGAALRVSQW